MRAPNSCPYEHVVTRNNQRQNPPTHPPPDGFPQGSHTEQRYHGQKSTTTTVAGGGRAPNGDSNEAPTPADDLPSARHSGLRLAHDDDDGDYRSHFGCTDDDAHESPITSVAIRPPSPTSPVAPTTRAGVVRAAAAAPPQIAGRLWSKDRDGGVLMGTGGRGGGGGGVEGGKPVAHRGKGVQAGRWSQLGGLSRKRRTCRNVELADWIEANTNLVNVSPW